MVGYMALNHGMKVRFLPSQPYWELKNLDVKLKSR